MLLDFLHCSRELSHFLSTRPPAASGKLLAASWKSAGSKGPSGIFPKIQNHLISLCPYGMQSRFDWKIYINPVFHWKPNIILWSLRSLWLERFAPNHSQFWIWMRTLLCQCKKSTQSALFPASILAQMTCRKTQPYESGPLQMRRRGYNPPGHEMPSAAASIGYPWIAFIRKFEGHGSRRSGNLSFHRMSWGQRGWPGYVDLSWVPFMSLSNELPMHFLENCAKSQSSNYLETFKHSSTMQ